MNWTRGLPLITNPQWRVHVHAYLYVSPFIYIYISLFDFSASIFLICVSICGCVRIATRSPMPLVSGQPDTTVDTIISSSSSSDNPPASSQSCVNVARGSKPLAATDIFFLITILSPVALEDECSAFTVERGSAVDRLSRQQIGEQTRLFRWYTQEKE